jgi:flavin-dependent thymidylate synthase
MTKPIVHLVNWFDQPYNNSVAAARTCYSSRVIWPEEVAQDEKKRALRDRIAASIYKAGHHTTLQHGTFQFVLEQVSRQFIWSFLHAHPFYNSEQVSQRYVEVKPGKYYIPPLTEKARNLYIQAVTEQTQAYQELNKILYEPALNQYRKIFPRRNLEDKKWRNAVKKKCFEIARYVLPIGTFSHLYHTISGITLHRYNRLCQQWDVPFETRQVVEQMIETVLQVDPEFASILENPLSLEDTLEYKTIASLTESFKETTPRDPKTFIQEFDESLGQKTSLLLGYSAQAPTHMASAIRSVLGLSQNELNDENAIQLILNPQKNPYIAESLNLNSMSKLMRALNHCHFTFRKKISHTADSQDQRHRMTPGSRPVLSHHVQWQVPDYVTPPLIQESAQAQDLYQKTMEQTWVAMEKLRHEGASLEEASYLLPNAFPIRFEESGDLMAFHHKWTSRLCYTAQEEIWQNCRDEVLQVKEIFPQIGTWLHPPCTLRKMAKATPYCPEGDRFCGVRVWLLEVEDFERFL